MAEIYTRHDEPEHEEPEPRDGPQPDENYKVGFGKPPLHSQFKSGNKQGKGRRKGSKNLRTMVNEAASMKAKAKLNGQLRNLPKIELTLHQVYSKGASGDPKAGDKAIDLYERYGPQEDPSGPSPEQTRMNLDSLRDYLEMRDLFGGEKAGG